MRHAVEVAAPENFGGSVRVAAHPMAAAFIAEKGGGPGVRLMKGNR
jgi:hypothetical protein